MSGLFAELQRTSQALSAHSQGVYTAGRNMANVNNSSYARQRVVLGDRGTVMTTLGPQSLGVEALAVTNIRDQLLDMQVVRETSYLSYLEAESDAYSKAVTALGQEIDTQSESSSIDGSSSTDSSYGIGDALDDLFAAFSSLSADPRSDAERQTLYQQAETLVSRLNSVDERLSDIETDINDQIESDIDSINSILETISSLNQQIGRFEVGNPGSALDLRDERQAQLEELAQYMDFDVESVDDAGTQIRIVAYDESSNPVEILNAANSFNRLEFDGTSVTGGVSGTVLALEGGSIAGSLAARDGAIAELRSGLDTLTAQLVTAVNSAYNPGGAYSDFFDASGLTAGTIALDASLTEDNIRTTTTSDPGSNEIALAIADLAETSFSTTSGDSIDGTLASYYRSVVSDIANAASTAESRVDDQSTLKAAVVERRDSVSGVSLDEEMTDLIKYQRAFQASARVMQTIDEMLEVVIQQLG